MTTVTGWLNPKTGRYERRVESTVPTTGRKPATLNDAELREYNAELHRQLVQKQVEVDRLPVWKREQLKMAAYLRKLDQTIAQENAEIASRERARRRARELDAELRAHADRVALEHQRALRRQIYGSEQGVPGFGGPPSVAESMGRRPSV